MNLIQLPLRIALSFEHCVTDAASGICFVLKKTVLDKFNAVTYSYDKVLTHNVASNAVFCSEID